MRLIRPLAMTNANIPRKKKINKTIYKKKKEKKIKNSVNINYGIKSVYNV